MSDKEREPKNVTGDESAGSAATLDAPKKSPQRGKPQQLPPYKVLLHNDDVNDVQHVMLSLVKITSLSLHDAELKMLEAHHTGVSLILVTHRERAELYEEQFRSCNLTVTIEPDA